jgi:TonB family protein
MLDDGESAGLGWHAAMLGQGGSHGRGGVALEQGASPGRDALDTLLGDVSQWPPPPLRPLEVHMFHRWSVPVVVLVLAAVSPTNVAAQPLPASTGRVIEAADGDVVVLPSAARVSIVKRWQVQARLVYLAAQQTLLLLTDPALGLVEGMPEAKGLRRFQVQGAWPLEARWEGSVTVDEYVPHGAGPFGMAIHTDRGTIHLGPPHARGVQMTPPPLAVIATMSSASRMSQGSFDEIERAWLTGGDNAVSGPRASLRMHTSGVPGAVVTPPGAGGPAAPVRVGGNIRPPVKTHNAEAVYPPTAIRAGIEGVVILEITIGTDGVVSNARVLRSIPLLDQAALDTVRQWRYEPTLLNGAPVPVVMTATVNFALQPTTR